LKFPIAHIRSLIILKTLSALTALVEVSFGVIG